MIPSRISGDGPGRVLIGFVPQGPFLLSPIATGCFSVYSGLYKELGELSLPAESWVLSLLTSFQRS